VAAGDLLAAELEARGGVSRLEGRERGERDLEHALAELRGERLDGDAVVRELRPQRIDEPRDAREPDEAVGLLQAAARHEVARPALAERAAPRLVVDEHEELELQAAPRLQPGGGEALAGAAQHPARVDGQWRPVLRRRVAQHRGHAGVARRRTQRRPVGHGEDVAPAAVRGGEARALEHLVGGGEAVDDVGEPGAGGADRLARRGDLPAQQAVDVRQLDAQPVGAEPGELRADLLGRHAGRRLPTRSYASSGTSDGSRYTVHVHGSPACSGGSMTRAG
jgi:hypothetical protein